jgi:dihydrofolate reductase
VRTLLEADLVDELALMIEPIVLGGGKGIFPTDDAARPFELVSATTAGTGVRCAGTGGCDDQLDLRAYQRSGSIMVCALPSTRQAVWSFPGPCGIKSGCGRARSR